jgi:hypothetical protein
MKEGKGDLAQRQFDLFIHVHGEALGDQINRFQWVG